VVGAGTYYWFSQKNEDSIASLQSQIDDLKKVTPTPSASATAATPTPTATPTPSPSASYPASDWKTFNASTQAERMSFKYPATYTVTENSDGFITVRDASGTLVADSTIVPGDLEGNAAIIKAQSTKWFTTVSSSQTIQTTAGLNGIKVQGTFGAKVASDNAIADGSHANTTGSTYLLEGTTSKLVSVIDVYDNGSSALQAILSALVNSITY
jgi:hypothetical protein